MANPSDQARLTRAQNALQKARESFAAAPTLEHQRAVERARASHTRAVRILECRAHAERPPADLTPEQEDALFSRLDGEAL